MQKKLTWIFVLIGILLLGGIGYYLYKTGKIIPRAEEVGATLRLTSGSTSYNVGQVFPVYIYLNTGTYNVDSADVYLKYDQNFLEIDGIDHGTIFSDYWGLIGSDHREFDPQTGGIALTGFSLTQTFSGNGIFATIRFKGLQATASTTVDFQPGQNVVAAMIDNNPVNVLSSTTGTSFTFTGVPTPVSVDIKANGQDGPLTVTTSTTIDLSWTSANATSCSASNGWSGDKATSGSESIGTLTSSKTFTLTCLGDEGSNSDSVTINVSTDGGGKKPTPRETPPTEPPTEQPTEQPTQEPTEEPTAIPTEISYVTPTITPAIITSPAAGSPSPKVSPSPTPKFSPSPSPTTKVGGFAISPTTALLLYIGIPVVITLGVFYFWWRRRQKGGIPPPPDEDEWI